MRIAHSTSELDKKKMWMNELDREERGAPKANAREREATWMGIASDKSNQNWILT